MIAEYIKLEWDKQKSTAIDLGIIDIQARATVIPYRGAVIARNTEICQLDGMAQADTYDISVAFGNGQSYMLKFWQQSTNLGTIKSIAKMAGKALKDENDVFGEMLPKIYDAQGNLVGEMQYIPVQQPGLQSYHSNRMILGNKIIDCYEVGVERKIYFCMYDQAGKMVATVDKMMPVKNGKSRYTMYIDGDEWCQMVVMMTICMYQQYYEMDEAQGLNSSSNRLKTFQKGLQDKYQPGFIGWFDRVFGDFCGIVCFSFFE